MDWNWFFSSAAQSAAAIVGIFAAFIITKIVNNQGEFSNKKNVIMKLISKSIQLEDEAKRRHFKWYCERTMENRLSNLSDRLSDDDKTISSEQYYREMKFPEFMEREKVLLAIQEKIENHIQLLRLDPLNRLHITTSFNANLHHLNSKELSEERDSIYKLINDTNHHIRDLVNFLNTIKNNPESSSLITFSILSISILFFVGVIYPLSFLPIEHGVEVSISYSTFWVILFSLKGAWLFSVSFIFNLILLVFLIINLKMKFTNLEISTLEKYSLLKNYSTYYEIMEKNKSGNNND